MPLTLFRFCLIFILLALSLAQPAAAQRRVNYADWKLEWAEEFNKPIDTVAMMARWRFAYPWGRNLVNNPSDVEYYSGVGVRPDSSGVLNLVATHLAKPIHYYQKTLTYSSGMLSSRHLVDSLRPAMCPTPQDGFSYGLFEVRCRQPYDRASFPAFWLWGGAPDEIDIFEANRWGFSSTLHIGFGGWWRPTRTQAQGCACFFHNADPTGDLHTDYHTYGLEWLPNELIFYYDGMPIRHETRLVPEGCGMYLLLNLAMLDWSSVPGDTLAVDYIRVYRPRRVPPPVAVLPRGGQGPESEITWIPLEYKPGRLDPASEQGWTATPRPNHRLELLLAENRNPPCDQEYPLPLNGHWAPPWLVVDNLPSVRMRFAQSDSVVWQLADALGRTVAGGTVAAPLAGAWLPRWPADVPPGTYALHLRQGPAITTQPVVLVGRTRHDNAPAAAWLVPAPLPEELRPDESVPTK